MSTHQIESMFGWWLQDWLSDPMYLPLRVYLPLWGYEALAERNAMTAERSRSELLTFAVYGSLKRGERNDTLIETARYVGRATLPGGLYEVNDPRYPYPAYVQDDEGEIEVEVYQAPSTALLARLDDLGEYDPAKEATSEYLRRFRPLLSLETDRAWTGPPPAGAWVYEYNRATNGARIDRWPNP